MAINKLIKDVVA